MSAAELVEQLKQLSNPERLLVIEAATRLIREELSAPSGPVPTDPDRHLQEVANTLKDLYEPGGALSEWNDLDAEEVLDDYVQG